MRSLIRTSTLACVLLIAGPVLGSTVPTGFQEYYLLGQPQQIFNIFNYIRGQEGTGSFTQMNVVTTLTTTTDIQVVIWDHWEDGYESDPYNPVQASTLVLGDGDDITNGDALDFGGLAGDRINVDTTLCWPSRGTGPLPGPEDDYVPMPRVASDVRYDAPDRIIVIGGPVNLIHAMDPDTPYIGGATAIYPRQLLGTTTRYVVPVGEDLYGAGGHYAPFQYVYLQLVSYEDGVNITVDNGTTSVSFQLNEGSTWSSRGMINLTPDPTSQITIDAGTTVDADGPVTALLVTGSDGTYQTRFYTLLPEALFDNDYITPVHGDNNGLPTPPPFPSFPDRRQNLYLYNPNAANLNVTAYYRNPGIVSTVITVPANGVISFTEAVPGNIPVPVGSTVRFTAPDRFWGLAAMDYLTTSSDWGYGFVPMGLLADHMASSWAPGNNAIPPSSVGENGAPLFISPVADRTLVKVDLDGLGFQQADINGDGTNDAYTGVGGYLVDTLRSLRIYDRNDRDQTNIRIYASNRFSAAWGQDTDVAVYNGPVLDLGYEMMPQDDRFVDRIMEVTLTADRVALPPTGGAVVFTIVATALDGPITDVNITHQLPAGFTYDAGTTTVTFPSGPPSYADPTGASLLDWNLNVTLQTDETLTVELSASAPAGLAEGRYDHTAYGTGIYATSLLRTWELNPSDRISIYKGSLDAGITVSAATVRPGPPNQLTYTATVTNRSGANVSGAQLRVPIPFNTTFSSADQAPGYDGACNCVKYDVIGDLAPSATATMHVVVDVNATAPTGSFIYGESRADATGTLETVSPRVPTRVVAPDLAIILSAPSVTFTLWHYDYLVTVTNNGNEAATSVILTMDVPDTYTTYDDESMWWNLNGSGDAFLTDGGGDDEGEYFPAGPLVELDLGATALAPGETFTFWYTLDVTSGVTGDTINALAQIACAEVPPVTSNSVLTTIDNLGDADLDGLSNTDEINIFNTLPDDQDSDDDGINDYDEINWDGIDTAYDPLADLDPNNHDTDGDGVFDGTEIGVTVRLGDTDPGVPHFRTDQDPGTTTDPLDPDTDADGLSDGDEDFNKDGDSPANEPDPNDADSDDDGAIDGDEIDWDLSTDGDGVINVLDEDSDDDGLHDGQERGITAGTAHLDTDQASPNFVVDADPSTTTSMVLTDSDADGLDDNIEDANLNGAQDAGEPAADDADSDDDGALDGDETNWDQDVGGLDLDTLINVLDWDSDGDGLADGLELGVAAPHPTDTNIGAGHFTADGCPPPPATNTTSMILVDTDGDNLNDGTEDADGDGCVDANETDPRNVDTDFDTFNDDIDNCPVNANNPQTDQDNDLVGDACDTCTDLDGDGYGRAGLDQSGCTAVADDCDDGVAASDCGTACSPAILVEACDGFDNDCAGGIPANEADDDGDGYIECGGYVDNGAGYSGGADCDDGTAASDCGNACSPGILVEACDGFDNDCDGTLPAGENDDDGDGYIECPGYVDNGAPLSGGGDCDDGVAASDCGTACSPAILVEACDGFDNDCAGGLPANEADDDGDGYIECSGYVDNGAALISGGDDCDDGTAASDCGAACSPGILVEACDGFDNDCAGGIPANEADDDGDGYIECSGYVDNGAPLINGGDDCDDGTAAPDCGAACSPGIVVEACDGFDNDCDGTSPASENDDDGDGYIECPGYVDNGAPLINGGDDCDDGTAASDCGNACNPGIVVEACDGFDNDCAGGIPANEADDDGDGHIECSGYVDNGAPLISGGDDCDDGTAASDCGAACSPGIVVEACDGFDNDCDGTLPAGENDDDGDGYIECPGYIDNGAPLINGGDDCDDGTAGSDCGAACSPAIMVETCDGFDNNCDNAGVALAEETDDDSDGYIECAGYIDNGAALSGGDDCDDGTAVSDCGAACSPGIVAEACDGFDNDCDGTLPAGENDDDGDGYIECPGYVDNGALLSGGGDCDDNTGPADCGNDCNPGVPVEQCDGFDTDCDNAGVPPANEVDQDLDGYIGCQPYIERGVGFTDGNDCDETNFFINLGASENCSDSLDNDCDGLTDAADVGDCSGICDDDDSDGYNDDFCGGSDCDDGNPNINPGMGENCTDGFDNNCDGYQDAADPLCPALCDDDDGDGYGDLACGGTDCDDSRLDVNPGAVEICSDTVDNDCDGLIDGFDAFDCPAGCPDADGDGYLDDFCDGSDCDDTNLFINPGAGEHCTDTIDNNCDGQVDGADSLCPGCADVDGDGYEDAGCGGSDCDDTRFDINPGRAEICTDLTDNDCDGLVDGADLVECPAGCDDADNDGYLDDFCGGTDCDDSNVFINPGAGEHCFDGVDNNCDGSTDIDDPLCPLACIDFDSDGHEDDSCGGSDCDDTRFDINPGRVEICTDLIDNDCDGLVDDLDPVDCPAGCADGDNDGYLDDFCGGSDCDDANQFINPGAGESCIDGADNNCDGLVDGTDPLCPGGSCADDDVDGHQDSTCGGSDCRDDRWDINPGRAEICDDGIDNDCDGLVDTLDVVACPDGCPDADSDGYRDDACDGTDCDDSNLFINPGAGENCVDGIDNNCDGSVDAADTLCPGGSCADADLDGYQDDACGGSDCNDGRWDLNPGRIEICDDGFDNDCDGLRDGADIGDCPGGCFDADNDGYFDHACGGTDCEDANLFIHPGAGENCVDGLDNNCDGLVDGVDPLCPGGSCTDADLDGYQDDTCGGSDCDDTRFDINPGRAEICIDSIDNDCDGLTDTADAGECPSTCGDDDGDGYFDAVCSGTDCDDDNVFINPGAGEHCTDGSDNNCDGLIDAADPLCPGGSCADADLDGYQDATCGGSDCDEARADINPGRLEICSDLVDNDCDSLIDDADFVDCPPCADADNDGYPSETCGGSDCDDTNLFINPGAGESCVDGFDNNCDGNTDGADTLCPGGGCPDTDLDGYQAAGCGGSDCDDARWDINPGTAEICTDLIDNDCDFLADGSDVVDCPSGCLDNDSDGYFGAGCGGSDCNDANMFIHPGAGENCGDGIDNNCDGDTDGADSLCPGGACADGDLDGYQDRTCGGSDCDDTDPLRNPGRLEICTDGIDNDCDLLVDNLDPGDCPLPCDDDDGDGYRDTACGGRDCDDSNLFVNPGAGEHCADGFDNNCDGLVDDNDPLCPGGSCTDTDLDGYQDDTCGGSDCDDADPYRNPGRAEVCGDGIDNDCDSLIDSADLAECPGGCADADNDGYLDLECGGSDCDDDNLFVNPGAGESCIDGRDNNCDGHVDGADPLCPTGCADADADGYADGACGGSDCNDTRLDIHPGRAEICSDGVDNDCDGLMDAADLIECPSTCGDGDGDGYFDETCGGTDCDDASIFTNPGAGENCVDGIDNNCDGLVDGVDPRCSVACGDADGDGYDNAACGGSDCDDAAFGINPGRVEACTDGVDNDCDGLIDGADPVDCPTPCADVDVDGYYDDACDGTDCEDTNFFVNPGAGESCHDGIDNNCDGLVDGDDPRCPSGCADADHDDYADAACGGSDCDDAAFGINPGRPENCADGADNDCDSLIDSADVTECPAGCADSDGDGFLYDECGGFDCVDTDYGINPAAGEHCADGVDNNCDSFIDGLDPLCPAGCADADGDNYFDAACGGSDCDDSSFFTHPGALENCADGADNDCDGLVDDADPIDCPPGCDDADGDGFYDVACGGSDCDDTNWFINPGAGEHCTDGTDNNCDGSLDVEDPFCPAGCADLDGDGYVDVLCGGSDCDDTRLDRNPGAAEICGDDIDNDCDDLVDDLDRFDCPAGCDDLDSDGYLDTRCGGSDCNDTNQFVHPGAGESCGDNVDNNCDGQVDSLDPLCPAGCADADDDGYADTECGGSDCDDANATTYPGAAEDCTDGADNNCDGLVDSADPIDCPGPCVDSDGDGYPDVACGGSDCDDTSFFVNPGSAELCSNTVDDECDGLVDFDDLVDCPGGCTDSDYDGYLDQDCGGADCAPLDPSVHPGAAENCDNGSDDNCDGLVDSEDPADCPAGCADADGDGYPDLICDGTDCDDAVPEINPGADETPCDGVDNDCNVLTLDPPDADRDDYVAESCPPGDDCNDDLPLVNPGAGENCVDTIDNNCDDLIDDEDPLCPPGCVDADGDNYAPDTCGGSDCDDGDRNVHPGAGESCDDGIDNDCDGLTDGDDGGDCPAGCLDKDADGYAAAFCGGTDCDDNRFDTHPGAGENCGDGMDNDCNGLADDSDPASCPPGCADADGDGYRDVDCGGTDCDDTDLRTHPAAGEDCSDGVDNNCDDRIDDADPYCPPVCADADGDGYPDVACGGSDCDDNYVGAHPGAVEMCVDGADNDCDGMTDEADPSCPPGCRDEDGDGYYDVACGGQDCDDNAAWIYPAAGESCTNDADDNCNGLVDGADPLCPLGCADNDGDGYADADCGGSDCDDTNPAVKPTGGEHCGDGVDNDCDGRTDADDILDCPTGCALDADHDGYLASACGGSDCNDSNGEVNPGAVEDICNGEDDDCNPGTVDDADPTDADGDGYTLGCGDDCNDANPFIHANVAEQCDDGRDNDCDGLPDEEDNECPAGCADADRDGYRDLTCGGTDCDDSSFGVNPGAGEHCADGVDNDCDGLIDDDDEACDPDCVDADADGYRAAVCDGSDCDDGQVTVHPGAGENCSDGLDNDCNGFVDEDDWGSCPLGCTDADADGYPSAACGGTDCDDAAETVHPAAEELCDDIDDDCDGLTDEGFADDDGNGIADCAEVEEEGGFGIAGGGCQCGAAGGGLAWLIPLAFGLRRRQRSNRR